MLRIGILGAGFMGSTHGRALKTLPGVEIAGIYAHSETRAAPLADELGASWTTDLNRLIDDDSLDAIDVCLPTPWHRSTTEAAIAAGKHVLLEKPIAMTVEDADAIVQLGESSDKVLMIAHVLRFWPEYVELQRRVASGELGRPIAAMTYRRSPFPAWSTLFSQAELTGGAVIDMLVHDYDMVNWILGTPRSVVARGIENARSGGFDQAQVLIDYGSGSALCDGGMMAPETYPFSSTLQVLCERGSLEYHFRAGGRSVEQGQGTNELMLYPNDGEPHRLDVPQDNPYRVQVEHFVECVRAGHRATRATAADARLALQVALAARASVEAGGLTPVNVK